MLYTNLFSLPWTVLLFLVMNEQRFLVQLNLMTVPALFWVCASCVVGVGISYSGWALRDVVSATTYSLVGVLNKMASIAFSVVVFPSNTTFNGVACLTACIGFGLFYVDPPRSRNTTFWERLRASRLAAANNNQRQIQATHTQQSFQ